jgi:hypothetical protein
VLTAVLALVLAVSAMTSCTSSSGGTPRPAPSTSAHPSSSPSPTPSPSPSRTGPLTTGPGVLPGEKPPPLDPVAKQRTAIGAQAFAAYYIKVLDWSYATSDAYLLRVVSAPTCATCKKIIGGLTTLREEGGHILGDRLRLKSALLQSFTGKIKSDYIVKVVVTQEPGAIVHPTATTDRNATSTVTSFIYLSWINGWKILGDFGP